MRGRERLHAALHGGDWLAFAPRLWAGLPSFVHLARPAEFWRDVGSTERMLSDAARVCSAEAVTIPVPPRPLSAERLRALPSEYDVVELDDVVEVVAVLERLRAIGEHGSVAELPGLAELDGLFSTARTGNLEDVLSDLVRVCLEAGAQAVLARAATGDDLTATLEVIGPIAEFFQAGALGVDGVSACSFGDRCRLGLMGRDGIWPEISRGVVVTNGDLTRWWTPDDVRAVVGTRGEGW